MREIELKPSRRLGLLLLAMTALMLAAIQLAALPIALKAGLGIAVAGLVAWGGWRAKPMACLRLAAGGRLQGRDGNSEWHDVEVLGDSFVSAGLIVLRYRSAGGPLRSLTLLPDSAAPDDLRRLRVQLRWALHTRSDTSSPDAG